MNNLWAIGRIRANYTAQHASNTSTNFVNVSNAKANLQRAKRQDAAIHPRMGPWIYRITNFFKSPFSYFKFKKTVENIRNNLCKDFDVVRASLTRENLVTANLSCMVDTTEKADLQKLQASLDDPGYSSSNFDRTEVIHACEDSPSKFIAYFKNGKSIQFSNRISGIEFRGTTLRNALEKTEYTSLRDMAKLGYMTETDSLLIYMSIPVRNMLYAPVVSDLKTPQEKIALNRQLALISIGKTNLAKLWRLPVKVGQLPVEPVKD